MPIRSQPQTEKLMGWMKMGLIAAFLSACGTREVVVEGNFPEPILDPLPVTIGVMYSDAFSQHEVFDEAVGRTESDWLVKTGDAQVEFWNTLFAGMFEDVIRITDHDSLHARESDLDAVIIPYVVDLQYTVPLHTNVKVYEIWMKYRFRLVPVTAVHDHENGDLTIDPAEQFADWTLTAYGKTPTAFLQSDEEAVNLAAVVALRDAGANFVTKFGRVEGIQEWLKGQPTHYAYDYYLAEEEKAKETLDD